MSLGSDDFLLHIEQSNDENSYPFFLNETGSSLERSDRDSSDESSSEPETTTSEDDGNGDTMEEDNEIDCGSSGLSFSPSMLDASLLTVPSLQNENIMNSENNGTSEETLVSRQNSNAEVEEAAEDEENIDGDESLSSVSSVSSGQNIVVHQETASTLSSLSGSFPLETPNPNNANVLSSRESFSSDSTIEDTVTTANISHSDSSVSSQSTKSIAMKEDQENRNRIINGYKISGSTMNNNTRQSHPPASFLSVGSRLFTSNERQKDSNSSRSDDVSVALEIAYKDSLSQNNILDDTRNYLFSSKDAESINGNDVETSESRMKREYSCNLCGDFVVDACIVDCCSAVFCTSCLMKYENQLLESWFDVFLHNNKEESEDGLKVTKGKQNNKSKKKPRGWVLIPVFNRKNNKVTSDTQNLDQLEFSKCCPRCNREYQNFVTFPTLDLSISSFLQKLDENLSQDDNCDEDHYSKRYEQRKADWASQKDHEKKRYSSQYQKYKIMQEQLSELNHYNSKKNESIVQQQEKEEGPRIGTNRCMTTAVAKVHSPNIWETVSGLAAGAVTTFAMVVIAAMLGNENNSRRRQ